MVEYHVGCGIAGIYAGTLKKNGIEWQNKSLVIDEAINAVRDYLMLQKEDGENHFGYEWSLKNGGRVQLLIMVEAPKGDNNG